MPKKSKRRAKAGGSGGGGKGAADDKKKQTAKNSDDEIENNIHPAGILTAGAVRVLSKCAHQKRYSVPKNSAPFLQVVSPLEEGADSYGGTPMTSYSCYLSDGTQCIEACFSSLYTHGYAHLLATNQVVEHSVIRVPSYHVVQGKTNSGVQNLLMVVRVGVVERDVGYVLGRTLPASCAVDGILTDGAIRMLLKKECMNTILFAGTSAPTLQVISDPRSYFDKDGVEGYATVELSDGRDWIEALLPSSADKALRSAELVIKHSIIRMDSCIVAAGTVFKLPLEDRVLVLGGVGVIATNVGRLIGNPTKVKKSGNPTLSSGSPSIGLVRESWSYDKKLKCARKYYIEAGRLFSGSIGDIGPALHHLSSYFQLPREQTEPFRAGMLLKWRIMLNDWPSLMKKQNGGQFTAEMLATYDRVFANDRNIGLLKRLSSVEGGESLLVRAVASFIRGVTELGSGYECGGFLSCALSCLRRFSALLGECDLDELASTFREVSGEGAKACKMVVDEFVTDCTKYFSAYGGPSQRQVSSLFDLSPGRDAVSFCFAVGGNFCDCCGKTTEQANLPVLFKCKACRLAWYCSVSCQAKCWNDGHRDCCKKFGRFEKGDQVILEDLKKRPDLNGALVSVEDLPLNGRATVRVIWSKARSVQVGMFLSIKKENLRHHRPLK